MTRLTSLFLIVIFLVCLVLGILGGFLLKPPPIQITETPTFTPKVIDPVARILVLGVKNFEDEVLYLESVWQVTVLKTSNAAENNLEVILVARYPFSAGQGRKPWELQYLEPHPPIPFPSIYLDNLHAFELLNTNQLIKRSDFYFDEVIVVDEYAINYLLELTNLNPALPPDPPGEDTFVKPWDAPLTALDLQNKILQALCGSPHHILNRANFEHIFDLLAAHMKTTLSPEEIIAFWQVHINLPNTPTITCKIYP
jgi:hypothetical protein